MTKPKKNIYKIVILQNGDIKKIKSIGRDKDEMKIEYKALIKESKDVIVSKSTMRDKDIVVPVRYELALLSDNKKDASSVFLESVMIKNKKFYIVAKSKYKLEEKMYVLPHKKRFYLKEILSMLNNYTILSVYLVGNRIMIFDGAEINLIFNMVSKSKTIRLYKVLKKHFLGKFFFYERKKNQKLPIFVVEKLNELDLTVKKFHKYRKEKHG